MMNSISFFLRDRLTVLTIIFVVFALCFPYVHLATSMLIFAILAVSFNLMLGYAGLLSFGHAALFAIGAYTMGILLVHFKVNIFLGIAAGATLTAFIAFIIGWVSIRRHGIYFAMLTLAFNEVVYFTILELKGLTGGDDGLRGIFRPDMNFGFISVPIQKPIAFYFFVLFFFILSILIIRRIINSPIGSVFLAIRENERRAETVGYNTRNYKIVAFVVSGFFAGLAGSLFCIQIKFAALSFSHWSLSGEVIIMALVGGIGSLYGPILGAAVVMAMQDLFSNMWDRWLLVLGLVFVIFVMFFPGGIWEGIENVISRYYPRFMEETFSE
jgi:branched-chain amino acid transport system permease protein